MLLSDSILTAGLHQGIFAPCVFSVEECIIPKGCKFTWSAPVGGDKWLLALQVLSPAEHEIVDTMLDGVPAPTGQRSGQIPIVAEAWEWMTLMGAHDLCRRFCAQGQIWSFSIAPAPEDRGLRFRLHCVELNRFVQQHLLERRVLTDLGFSIPPRPSAAASAPPSPATLNQE